MMWPMNKESNTSEAVLAEIRDFQGEGRETSFQGAEQQVLKAPEGK